jgi:Tol biopolymer transport system component
VPLSPGTRLGVYEIVSAVGAGGMGEVYRARDTRLGRDVAVKVVLEAFVADRDRLARFEREARSLAALNHPNVATLHGMEESGGRHFLVMELIDGPTLAELVAAGVPLDAALKIAIQIAAGLEAAHEKGIVHRDLKPANVKISLDDTVKVLDFGLAKSGTDPAASGVSASAANSPTFTATGTLAGVILGTAAYMSPEQARGMTGDHRSDIFSFGVVLYEMLTGRQPFQGETISDVLAAVLARDPDLTALPPVVAPRLIELVKRCLEKHPKRRWQAIGDVRHELEIIAANPRGELPAATHAAPPPRSWWRRAVPIAAAAVLAAAVTALAFVATRRAPAAPVTLRFSVPCPEGQQRNTIRSTLAISPDGMQIAFVANRELYVRALSEQQPRKLERGAPASSASTPMSLAFSPDGRAIAYYEFGEDKIKRIEVAGGPPAIVCASLNPIGLTWSGDALYFSAPGGIRRVAASGGEPEIVIKSEVGAFNTAPQILEDGRLLYSAAGPEGDADRWVRSRILVQRPGDAEPTTVLEGGSDPYYLPSGHLVYQASGVLIARRYDPRSGTLGSPAPVIDGVMRGSSTNSAGEAWYEISRTGTLVYMPGPVGTGIPDRRLAWFDRAGTPSVLPLPPGPYEHPRVSRDGKRIAFSRVDGNDSSIWVYDLAGGGSPRRVTFGGRDRFPTWSSDGEWIHFSSDRGGDASLYRQRVDGSAAAERLTTSGATVHAPMSASPDGSVLLYVEHQRGVAAKLIVHSFKDRTARPFGDVTSPFAFTASFSPDGRWVVYAVRGVNDTNFIPYVQPYPATGVKYQITSNREGGHTPVWSPDGRQLFFSPGPTQLLTAVNVTTTPSFSFGPADPVKRGFISIPPTLGRPYDVAGPGLRFLGLLGGNTDVLGPSPRDELRVVTNWVEELKARVK